MGSKPQIVATPEQKQLVTDQILRLVGLNAQAFSGAQNPSTNWRMMTSSTFQSAVFPLYRETEEKDPAVASALATRRLLVLGRDTTVQAADPSNGQARLYAEAAAAFIDEIRKFRWALWEMLDAHGYGFAVAEIMWATDGARIRVDRIVGRPQEVFRFGALTQPQTGELLLAQNGVGEGEPVPPQKFLVSTYQPRHGDRRGQPLLRKLYWPSWFKRNALRLDLQFLEKGSGTIAVHYPSGAEEAEKTNALNAAEAIATEIAVAVPESFKVMAELLGSTRTREGKDYQQAIDYFDAEMTRIVLGQTLSSRGAEQGAGSRALGDVHLETLFEIIRSDALDLEDVVNEQLLAPWGLWTFGPQFAERAFRPTWRIDKDPPKDLARAADLLTKARAMGMQIAVDEAHERLQLRKAEEGEAVLPPPFGGGLIGGLSLPPETLPPEPEEGSQQG